MSERPRVKFIARKATGDREGGKESICSKKGKIMILEVWE